jgi:hypothetical protein
MNCEWVRISKVVIVAYFKSLYLVSCEGIKGKRLAAYRIQF